MKLAIAGASGRMGRTLIEAGVKSEDMQLAAALDAAGSAALGKDAGEALGASCGVTISADYAAGIAASDCLIDFTFVVEPSEPEPQAATRQILADS